MNPRLVMWEAVYRDGSTIRESEQHYSKLKRFELRVFRFLFDGQVVREFYLPDGERLVYRRSVLTTTSGKEDHLFLVGLMPGGPAWAWNPQTDEVEFDSRGFHPLNHECWQHSIRKCVWLQSPKPHPWEGERVW